MFLTRFDLRSPDPARTTELYAAAIEMVEWAETRGCLAVAVSEHHASPDGFLPSPLVLASAMAARTQQVSFMVAAALLPFYDPIRLAEDMAVLDHISNGRVSYVFGLGYRAEEFALYDLEMKDRARIADDKLRALLDALAGKQVAAVEGEGVKVTPSPRTPNGPSIAWGGQSTAAARRAARFGLDFFAQTDGDNLAAAYYDECEKQGHPPGNLMLPSPATPSTIFVADDVDRAWDELGSYLLHDATTYAAWNPQGNTASLSYGKTVDELRAENGAHRVWTVDEAVDWVRRNGYLGLHPLCGGIPPEIAWPYLRRVTDEVVPAAAAP